MVHLEEVEDRELSQAQPGPVNDEDYDSADFVDTSTTPIHLVPALILPLPHTNNPHVPQTQKN